MKAGSHKGPAFIFMKKTCPSVEKGSKKQFFSLLLPEPCHIMIRAVLEI